MSSHQQGRHIYRILILLLILLAAIIFTPVPAHSQGAGKKLTKQDVIDLLTGDVPSERVADIAKQRGVSFPMDAAAEKDIRAAGGSDDLIRTLRGLAPRAPAQPPRTTRNPSAAGSPTVLMIQSRPGDTQVYIDDEPMGSTSPEGRLKLRVSPGNHTVRVALSGYQDYEENITVAEGQTTTVAATLQANAPPPPVYNPPQRPEVVENPTGNPGQVGYLGVLPIPQQPAGAQGVVISTAYPGSPAEQAGLKTYDTILAVNGQPVRTQQELQAAITSHPPGDAVRVTWYNGSTNVTKAIRLVVNPEQARTTTNQPAYPPSLTNMPHTGFVTFTVAHDHGQNGQNYCVGVMSIGNGMIYYKANNGMHTYEIPLNTVREARRNAVYLAAVGGFHIKLAKGTNFNFVALNAQGQWQPPEPILNAIERAMGK